jgi:osmotically-inducible protein OsmY
MLSGNVDNQNQIDRAVQIASNVDGVKTVSNRLTVKK